MARSPLFSQPPTEQTVPENTLRAIGRSSLFSQRPPMEPPVFISNNERVQRMRSLVKERNDLMQKDFWITDENKKRLAEIRREETELLYDPGMSKENYEARIAETRGLETAVAPWEFTTGLGAYKTLGKLAMGATLKGAAARGASYAVPMMVTDQLSEYALDKMDINNPWARISLALTGGLSIGNLLEIMADKAILKSVNAMAPNFFSKHLEDLLPAGTTNISDIAKARADVLKGRIDEGDVLALEELSAIIRKARYGKDAESARLTRIAGEDPEETVKARFKRLRERRFEDMSPEDMEEINDLAKIKTMQSFDPQFEKVKHRVNANLASDAYVNHPVVDMADNIARNGGFNETRMRLMWGDENVDALKQKYPGMITPEGQVDPIKKAVAREMSVDEMRDHLLEMPDFDSMLRSTARNLDYEWKLLYQDEFASRTGGTELKMWEDIGGPGIVKRIRQAVRKGVPRVSGDSILMRRLIDETNLLRRVGRKADTAYRTTAKADERMQELVRAGAARDAARRKEGLIKVKGRMSNALRPNSAPEEYQEQLHNLLNPYMGSKARVTEGIDDLRTFLDNKIVEGVPLAKLIRDQYDDVMDLPARIPKIDDLTVGEYKKFGALVNDLRRMGINQRKIDTVSENQAIEDYVKSIVDKSDPIYKRKFRMPSFRRFVGGEKLPVSERADKWSKRLASIKRPEHILRELDVWDDFGPAQRMFRSMKLAEDENFQISKVLGDRWQNILSQYADDAGIKKFNNKFWEQRFSDSKSNISMTREQMLSAAAMTGNATNRAALRRTMRRGDGEEWSDIAQNRFFSENMTEADWKFVKNIWQMTDEMYNMLNDVFSRVTGRTLPKIENYFPIIPDYKFTKRGYTEDIEDAYMSMPNYDKIPRQVQKRFFKTRTDGSDAIQMDLDAMGKHFRDVAHSVSHWERTNDVRKVITNPNFKEMVTENLGEPKYDVLKNWIDDLIKPSRTDSPGWYKLRGRVTTAMLGWKFSTALAQTLSLYPAIPRVGKKNMMEAAARFMMHPVETSRAIREVSEQMAARNHTWQREINEMMKRKGAHRIRKMGSVDRDIFFNMIRGVDTMVANTVWYAGWLKGMQKYNGNQNRAIAYADQTVRLTQPQSALKDLPEIMRSGKEWDRLLTMFYSYYSVLHNQAAELIQRKRAGQASLGEVISGLNYMYLIPAMIRTGGIDREVDPKTLALNTATHVTGGFPVFRDIASGLAMGYDYSVSPVGSQISQAIDRSRGLFGKSAKVARGEEGMSSLLLPAAETAVTAAPLAVAFPSSQVMTLIRGIKSIAEEEDVDIFDILVRKRKREE